MIKVYYLNTANLTPAVCEKICKLLPAERVKKAEGYVRERDKLLSLGSSYLLYLGLKNCGVDLNCCSLIYGKYGKPYISGGNTYFNISHSGKLAVCAVSDSEVGVDVQKVTKLSERLVERILTPYEIAQLSECEENEGKGLITAIWAAKESYMKLLGTGIATAPYKLEVDFSDGIKIAREGTPCNVHLTEYKLDNYRLIVCSGKEKCVSKPIEISATEIVF